MVGKLRVLDLFSGIGGFSLGLERTGGFETVAFCEIEEFPRRVLAKHWPGVPIYDDVRTLTGKRLAADGIAVDVVCGGFPCQDLSGAGRQAGIDGERSGLWAEIVRLADELRPRYLLVENVANLLAGERGAWFGRVLRDLAALGYDAEWHCLPACHVGAPHERDRVWIVAYPRGEQHQGQGNALWGQAAAGFLEASIAALADPDECRQTQEARRALQVGRIGFAREAALYGYAARTQWAAEPNVDRMAYGVPSRVDRLRALGNAVVPQIPELIGRAILSTLKEAA